MEVAYRLLGIPTFDLVYEEEKKKKWPDFSVSSQFGNYYAEVKVIRQPLAISKFDECVEHLHRDSQIEVVD